MKFRFSLFLLIIVTLFSCKKESVKLVEELDGTWELQSETNGFSGNTKTYTNDNGDLFIFSKNHYQRFIKNQLYKEGSFQINKEKTLLTQKEAYRISLDYSDARTFVEIDRNKLTIYIDAYDGGSSTYIRK